jgi:hypothetical protein
MRQIWRMFVPGLFLLTGCWSTEGSKGLPLTSGNPFGTAAPTAGAVRVNLAASDSEAVIKVSSVGNKILAANPHIGMKPVFGVIGSPNLEIFHIESKTIYITESLVQKCKSEEDLAALLSQELGKMVAEREALAASDIRNPDRPLPINVPIGNSGQFNSPDQTHLVELAKHEKERPRRAKDQPRPDPQKLASGYLEKAGYPRTSLETVQPLLEEADRNCSLERQMKGLPPKNGWGP